MVDVRGQIVHADGVDAENLHESSIAQADVGVTQGILALSGFIPVLTTRLVGHTNNLELLAIVVDEGVALDLQRLDGGDNRSSKSY